MKVSQWKQTKINKKINMCKYIYIKKHIYNHIYQTRKKLPYSSKTRPNSQGGKNKYTRKHPLKWASRLTTTQLTCCCFSLRIFQMRGKNCSHTHSARLVSMWHSCDTADRNCHVVTSLTLSINFDWGWGGGSVIKWKKKRLLKIND